MRLRQVNREDVYRKLIRVMDWFIMIYFQQICYDSLSAFPFVGVSESEKNISEPPGLRMILFFVS